MDSSPAPLSLVRAEQDASPAPWRNRAWRLAGALAIHLVPLTLLLSALPLKPRDLGGAFGASVSVTLVSGSSAARPAAQPKPIEPSLANLERRLSDQAPVVAEAASPSSSAATPTRLSDLFDTSPGSPGQAAKGQPRPTVGVDDDPFARASVSYRGDDPEKTARLRSKAQSCTRSAKALRLLLIINSEGYLVARPRALGMANTDKAALKTISAIERCAPFSDAATPGPPRAYEIDIG